MKDNNSVELTLAQEVIGNLDFNKALRIILDGNVIAGSKSEKEIFYARDNKINAYGKHLANLKSKTTDPKFNSELAMNSVYTLIIQNKAHYRQLRQYPNDWLNLQLFAELWAYAELIKAWSKPEKVFTHFEEQLAHEFKVQAKIEPRLSAKELKGISSKRYEAHLSLTKKRQPTMNELNNTILLLTPYPEAQKLAIEYLNKHPEK